MTKWTTNNKKKKKLSYATPSLLSTQLTVIRREKNGQNTDVSSTQEQFDVNTHRWLPIKRLRTLLNPWIGDNINVASCMVFHDVQAEDQGVQCRPKQQPEPVGQWSKGRVDYIKHFSDPPDADSTTKISDQPVKAPSQPDDAPTLLSFQAQSYLTELWRWPPNEPNSRRPYNNQHIKPSCDTKSEITIATEPPIKTALYWTMPPHSGSSRTRNTPTQWNGGDGRPVEPTTTTSRHTTNSRTRFSHKSSIDLYDNEFNQDYLADDPGDRELWSRGWNQHSFLCDFIQSIVSPLPSRIRTQQPTRSGTTHMARYFIPYLTFTQPSLHICTFAASSGRTTYELLLQMAIQLLSEQLHI